MTRTSGSCSAASSADCSRLVSWRSRRMDGSRIFKIWRASFESRMRAERTVRPPVTMLGASRQTSAHWRERKRCGMRARTTDAPAHGSRGQFLKASVGWTGGSCNWSSDELLAAMQSPHAHWPRPGRGSSTCCWSNRHSHPLDRRFSYQCHVCKRHAESGHASGLQHGHRHDPSRASRRTTDSVGPSGEMHS